MPFFFREHSLYMYFSEKVVESFYLKWFIPIQINKKKRRKRKINLLQNKRQQNIKKLRRNSTFEWPLVKEENARFKTVPCLYLSNQIHNGTLSTFITSDSQRYPVYICQIRFTTVPCLHLTNQIHNGTLSTFNKSDSQRYPVYTYQIRFTTVPCLHLSNQIHSGTLSTFIKSDLQRYPV